MLVINLYARLVKDENSRTEALVDLLERALKKDQETKTTWFGHFISEVLLDTPTAEKEKRRFLNALKNIPLNALSIKTQYQTPTRKRPDIVIFSGNDPICVVEVKVDASIGENQLNNYDIFLQRTADGNPTALVLLTKGTQPPEGFANPADGAYHTSLRSVVSWNRIAKWSEEFSQESDVDEPLKTLAREFGEFLKEDAMPTLDDVTRARLYLAHSHDALVGAVKNMADISQLPDDWSVGKRGNPNIGGSAYLNGSVQKIIIVPSVGLTTGSALIP